eukprot:1144426-Pelagomonas_calceolata.AAC.11
MGCPAGGIPGAEGDVRMNNFVNLHAWDQVFNNSILCNQGLARPAHSITQLPHACHTGEEGDMTQKAARLANHHGMSSGSRSGTTPHTAYSSMHASGAASHSTSRAASRPLSPVGEVCEGWNGYVGGA